MPSPEERDAAKGQLIRNRAVYNELIEQRISGTVSNRDFSKRASALEKQGTLLRNIAGINTAGVGGIYCRGCGQFFTGASLRENIESFDECRRHASPRVSQIPSPVHY